MQLRYLTALMGIVALLLAGCSKKHQPQTTTTASENVPEEKKVTVKPGVPVKKVAKYPVSKVISVDDRAAGRTPDGRLYYDLEGKRYWKNYDDGKYYLFNKKMYSDPAFKPH